MKLHNLASLFLLMSATTLACSGPPAPDTAQKAYNEATYVYLAIAENITTTPIPTKYEPNLSLEQADFRVLEVWKGDLKPGDRVKYKEKVGGSCFQNIKNNPTWLKDEEKPEKVIPEFSGVWLIYTSEKNNIGGFLFSRSAPIEYGGIADMRELYEINRKKKK